MAEQKQVLKKQALKVVKKKWFPINASKTFDETLIGESIVASPAELEGRIITINLATLSDDLKQQHINLQFKVVSSDNEKASAELVGVEIMPAAIKRLVRRSTTRIDESFICETADSRKVRIKPFMLTKSYARGFTIKKLRKALVDAIVSEVKNVSFDELVRAVISNKLQTGIKHALKKIYPIKSCEIKFAGVVSKGKLAQVSENEPVSEVQEESKEKDSEQTE